MTSISKELDRMTTSNVPIACTLGGAEYAERLAWIARLNNDGLLSHECHDTVLELRYADAVRSRVHQLVQQESECCAFLTVTLDESHGDVRLTITAPDLGNGAADAFFEPFLTSVAPTLGAGRCTQPANGRCS